MIARPSLLRWSWLLLLLAMAPPEEPGPLRDEAEWPAGVDAKGPNILILIGDDHAAGTLGIDGDPREATPRLDRLAGEGVRFDRAYCNAPLCTPSRQSLLTGRLPHAIGVTRLMTPLPEEAVTLAEWLGSLGYATGAIGKMHFNGPSRHGFAERVDTPDWERSLSANSPEGGDRRRPWRPFKDPAAAWLNARCEPAGLPASAMQATFFADRAADFFRRHEDRPFALVVGFYEPHSPFHFPREWKGRYRPGDFTAPEVSEADRREQPAVFAPLTPQEVRGIRAAYYTSLSFLDDSIGRVLDALDAEGLAEETIVVYLGDNGYLLGEHGRFEKHCGFEQAVRVPLIVRWPGHLPAGRRVAEMVELVNVLPTLLDLGHLSIPPDLHGRSLVPLLEGRPEARGRNVVFSEYLENEEAMVRTARYKLIVGNGRQPRIDGYAPKLPATGPYERLYDLVADPGETTDVSTRPDLAAIKQELKSHLHDRLVTTREGLEPIPARFSRDEAIRWCLIPRDRGGDGSER